MVILEIYSKCVKIHYKTHLCSKAAIFAILASVITIVVPFIFAFNSRGFWIKHDTFYEQPDVKYRGEYLFNAITTNVSSPIICSKLHYYYYDSQDFSTFDTCSLVKVKEIDNNNDGKTDELNFIMTIEAHDQLPIVEFYLILTFDYSLHTVCPMLMQSAIIIQDSLPTSAATSEVNVIANMGLSQRSSLNCHPKWKNLQYNYSAIQSSHSFNLLDVLYNYSKRNISTHLQTKYRSFSTDNTDSEFSIKLKILFPEHRIYYTPSFWHTMKWAWLQYFSFYVVVAYLVQKIRSYVYEHKLVLFYETSPFKH